MSAADWGVASTAADCHW